MSSMAVAGLVKSLIAVTLTLNPAAAHHGPGSYTIRPGDTLSAIAARAYGGAADWPAIWWANRRQVPDPDLIAAGQRLALPGSHQVPPWLVRAALAAATVARPVPAAPADAAPAAPAASAATSSPPPASAGGVNWAAVAACESGGNWAASTGNGFYGGLQFTGQTWLGYGGGQYASSANLATPAQQIAVAQRVLAGQGIGAWPVCGRQG
jgi:LysM repeat protein